MVSNPQIISDLKVIQDVDHELEILTIYKGVPFICKASILEIEGDNVKVQAQSPYIVCLLKDKKPRILGSDYFEPSIASVSSLDIHTGKIELTNFSYVGTKLGERMIVRVVPKNNILVNLSVEELMVTGEMADISINGMGVRIDSAMYNTLLKPGTNINLNFKLPTGEITLSGTVLSALKLGASYRLSIRFSHNGDHKIIIFRYLIDRRAEIEQELLADYQTALKAR